MFRIGIDIGGTGIQVGVVDGQGTIIAEESIPTRKDLPFPTQVAQIAQCARAAIAAAGLTEDDIESVGIGIPGIGGRNGEIIKCTNMDWNHVPFGAEFAKHMNKPVHIANDADVAALAESVAGVSAGTSSSVFITIGTGIGSGIILNGKIWNGAHGIGGELGHVILNVGGVPCTCGNHGCLERYCSATALIRMGREAAEKHPESLMLKMAGGDLNAIKARTVIDSAREKDPTAVKVYRNYINYFAHAIASVVNLLDPEVIVLGGGVSNAGDFLLDALREEFPKHVIFRDQPMAELRIAVLGSRAGIIGAAMLS